MACGILHATRATLTSIAGVMLKRLIVLAFVPFLSSGTISTARGAGGKVGPDCTIKGKKLQGKFMLVNAFPDLKVQVVDAFPDLKCRWSTRSPTSAASGRWSTHSRT